MRLMKEDFIQQNPNNYFEGMVNIFRNSTVLRIAVTSKHWHCQLLCSLYCPLKVKMFAQN